MMEYYILISNSVTSGRTRRTTVLVVPDSMVPEVLAMLHNHGGYFRVDKTLNRVAKGFGGQAKQVQLRAM